MLKAMCFFIPSHSLSAVRAVSRNGNARRARSQAAMGQAASFPFEVSEPADASHSARNPEAYWKHFKGRRKADQAEVSIHKLDKVSTPQLKVEAGLHGFQKMKTMRHPYILQYLDGVDLEREVILVTESVTPLGEWLAGLKAEFREEQVAWGLRCISAALDFLTGSPRHMTHGMVCSQNIFVTKAGDWKLGGLDLLCEWREGGKDIFHFQLHEALLPAQYRAPERRSNDMRAMLKGLPGALDIWALGILIGEVVEQSQGKPPSGALASIQRRLLSGDSSDRPSAGQILRHSYFSPRGTKDLIRVLDFLENFSLKEDGEKMDFFNSLVQSVARLPPEVGLHKILPTFRDYVHVGVGGNVSNTQVPDQALVQQQARQRQLVLAALPVCLEILKSLDDAAFADMGEPLLVSLFGMNDRAIRAMLLQHLQPLASKLSQNNINGRLFDSVLTGFADSAPQLRELTLKSMLSFSHRLNEKNLNDRLMRCLTKLQVDPEPSIRTNTTIFLGRIAAQLKGGSHARVLLPPFLKACRDPFPHARLAGLKAAAACITYFDAQSMATKVLPVVASLLIDVDGAVRDAAFHCQDVFIKALQAHAQKMKEDEDKRQSHTLGKQAGGGEGSESLSSSVLGASAASLGGLTSSVAAWGAQRMWTSPVRSLSHSGSSGVDRDDLVSKELCEASMKGGTSGPKQNEDDFFDTLAPSAPGSRVAAAASEDWGILTEGVKENGWTMDDDDEILGMQSSFGTRSAGEKENTSLPVSGLPRVSEKMEHAGRAVGPTTARKASPLTLGGFSKGTTAPLGGTGTLRPVTDDDLFSMLNDPSPAPPSKHKLMAMQPSLKIPLSIKDGTAVSSPLSVSLPESGPKKAIGTGRSRLQAKKLVASKTSDWDDF